MARPQLAPGSIGTVSVRQRGATWQARAKARTHGGQLLELSAAGATEGEARAALDREFRSEVIAVSGGQLLPRSTVGVAIDVWLRERAAAVLAGAIKPQSYATYVSKSKGAREVLGAVPLHQVSPGLARDVVDALVLKRGPAYARGVRFVLDAAFQVAVIREAIPRNPLAESPTLRGVRPTRSALTPAQWKSMVASIEAWGTSKRCRADWRRLLALCVVTVATSLRIGETTALRPCDLRLDAEVPSLEVTGTIVEVDGHLIRQDVPKREGQERVIPLPRQAVAVLRELVARTDGPRELLFGTETGEPDGNVDRLMRSWRSSAPGREWIAEVGIHAREVTFKLLRRTAGAFVRSGAGLDAAQGLLGHSRSSTTETHYAVVPVVPAGVATLLEKLWD